MCNYNTHNLQLYLLTLRERITSYKTKPLLTLIWLTTFLLETSEALQFVIYCTKLHGPSGSLVDDFHFSKWYVLSELHNNLLRRSLTFLSSHPPFHSDNMNIKFLLLPCKQRWFLSDCLGMQREQLHQTFKTPLLYPLNPVLTLLLLWYLQISSIWYWSGIISSTLLFHCVHLAFSPP